jgi:predicted nucleotidyltransferase
MAGSPAARVAPARTRSEIASELRTFAASDHRILALYLFGSEARGEAGERSDVDVALLFSEPVPLRDRMQIEAALAARLGRAVDLVDLSRAAAFLALDALRGERLYCTDLDRCDEFELYVMRRAGDLAPFEHERRRRALRP